MDIFNELKEKIGCRYISDMRYNEAANNMAKMYFGQMDITKYSEKEIKDLREYLYGDKIYAKKLK